MNAALEKKLKTLPKEPGVYFHKDSKGEIIYVGKAARLNNRVRQYFQASRRRDPKTEALVQEIVDTDWVTVASEIDALFLEAEMVRRYMPRYNILLRDDKSLSYIRIDYNSDYPTVTTTRRPLDDGANYYGPYFAVHTVRQALRQLRKIFPFATRRMVGQKRATLQYHLGLDPGLEEGRTTLQDYRANLRRLISYIEGKRTTIIREIEAEMLEAAKQQNFELAAKKRNQLRNLEQLSQKVLFSDQEFLDISKDHALNELADILTLPSALTRIEGYDISHMQGTDVVASMVVFTNGVSDKASYRKFKTKRDHNNDFYNMNETIARRLSAKNRKAWGMPSLLLIDGGKGQLDAAIRARDDAGCELLPAVGLAKREEQIVVHKTGSNVSVNEAAVQKLGGYVTHSQDFSLINLPHSTHVIKLLQRIRDESHRFAVSYHSVLKSKRQTASALDDIVGVGPVTRKKLLKTFGSAKAVSTASYDDLQAIVGAARATAILRAHGRSI